MFDELDVVALTVDLPTKGLSIGNVGTIVHVYAPGAYKVSSWTMTATLMDC